MVDACHVGGSCSHQQMSSVHQQSPPTSSEWQVVARRSKWRRIPQRQSSLWPRRLVPTDLVGKCFNCLREGNVAAECPNPVRCFRYHREGHLARSCKRPQSPDATGPPPRPPKLASVVVINLGKGDPALAIPRPRVSPSQRQPQRGPSELDPDRTLPGSSSASTPGGSPLRHVLPSPPRGSPTPRGSPFQELPPSSMHGPPGASQWRCFFELRVIPRTLAMNDVETILANTLVVMISGSRPPVSQEQVRLHLTLFYGIAEDVHSRANFLLIFTRRQLADVVLHAPLPQQMDLRLTF
jgi:hypothetical protein